MNDDLIEAEKVVFNDRWSRLWLEEVMGDGLNYFWGIWMFCVFFFIDSDLELGRGGSGNLCLRRKIVSKLRA